LVSLPRTSAGRIWKGDLGGPGPLPTTGVAGEHYVMYRLLRRGLIAAVAPTGVPNADIIVRDVSGIKFAGVAEAKV
jgi:hypothetical protein